MTLRELFNAIRGYDDRAQLAYRAGWEQTRMLAVEVRNAKAFSKKFYRANDIMKFPWDGEGGDHAEGIEEIKERRKWRTQ